MTTFTSEDRASVEKAIERKTIWVGEFEFFDNYISNHAYQFCLIHRLHEVKECTEKELEKIALEEALDWIIPNEYKGDIAFSQGFMRNLGGNISIFERGLR